MKTLSTTFKAVTCALFIMALSAAAQAQATRTWVSGVGDDVNPCSRTAPCKTFAGAISKTAAGGEIDALDPGGFGAITITKSILIDGTTGAGFGSILASGVNGVNVNDSATASPNTINVKLRNLSINGAGTTLGINGVNFTSGATLHVENCRIMNFSGDGIRKAAAVAGGAGRVIVQDTIISDCASDGVESAGANTSRDAISLDRVSITRCGNGVKVSNRADVAISNSVISLNNATGSSAAVILTTLVSAGAVVDIENTQMNYNSVGVQPITNNAIRLSNVHMTGNANALNFGPGGTIATYNNNRIFGNAGGEAFGSLTDVFLQ